MAKKFTDAEKLSANTELSKATAHIAAATTAVTGLQKVGSGYDVTDPIVDELDKAKARITVALVDLGGKPCGGGRPC